ncbi:MAG: alpha-L-rhamnosidase N-terminal domain-containing protein, partial [Gemmatimonadales bacterium]
MVALFVAAGARSASAQAVLGVTGLRTGYLTDPVGVDGGAPRLSWRIESTGRNTVQSAYQIQVAVDSADLQRGAKLLWDSGRVTSDASLFQAYAGPPLRSRTRYRWRVRVWDAGGQASPWSTPAFWETGLLARDDWSARWIRPPAADHDSAGAPAPMLRRAFDVKGLVRWARIYVTSLGLYELHLNGQRVSRDLFTPGWTSYTKRLQYQTYDVTHLLVPGENAIGAILGDGWYRGFLG